MLSQLRDLDLQLLRLFVCVVECGGFSAAQGELGIGQSTISTQMAKLETRLGYRLCERGKAGFRLTPKGEQVLAATRRLFAAIEQFKGEAQGMADKLLGELRIGLSEALDAQVLERVAAAIGRFRQRNQAVQIELLSAMPAELERRLLQDQLHLAIDKAFQSVFAGDCAAPRVLKSFRRLCSEPEFHKEWPGIGVQRCASYIDGIPEPPPPFPDVHGPGYEWLAEVERSADEIIAEFERVMAEDAAALEATGSAVW